MDFSPSTKHPNSLQEKQASRISQELYPRYREIWRDLFNESLVKTFKLEFKKKLDYRSQEGELWRISDPINIDKALELTREIPWRFAPYDKQHWGHWLHSLSPYVGRITPAFAHWLIKIYSKPGDTVFDPFCGIGTIPLEVDILQRIAIGNDLNPYAWTITKGKFDRHPIDYHLNYLRNLELDLDSIELDPVPAWVRAYFQDDTLKEILFITNILKEEQRWFLLACLMGILHGNRPGYLSVWTGCIIPMKPRSPSHPKFRPDKDVPEYRAVIPRLAAKVLRMYQDTTLIPKNTLGRVLNVDTRSLSLEPNSVDVIISSPPYYDTLDYLGQNKLRLYFLGYPLSSQEDLKRHLIQNRLTYLKEMLVVGRELHRVLKPGGYIVYILGDVFKSKSSLNTASDIAKLYENALNFRILDIIPDEIPRNKCAVQKTQRKKLDRVLIMQAP
ncbi:MAG: DNA methyltransferase [Candidatus Hodarchaeota archaeon]